mmetsp:Transcript_15606/g.20342  ORF Transcript_15606/g.20342 Transcript_15606/m.20342 type:complete len:269 (+) Transcript_15606:70-876(+)
MRLLVTAILLHLSTAFVPTPSFSPNLKCSSVARLPAADFQLHVVDTRRKPDAKMNIAPDAKDIVKASSESKNALSQLSENYQQLQKDYYLPVAFLQAGVLASCADIATQTMEAPSVDFGHVAAMATVASIMSGAANAAWLRQLENNFPGTGTKEVAYKTLIHATIIAFIINSAYLAFVPFFTTYLYGDGGAVDPSIIFSGWSVEEFATLTKIEILMFVPYNTLAFKFIPPTVRPLTHALMSATFNVAVSAVTLGYFDQWCASARHLFS